MSGSNNLKVFSSPERYVQGRNATHQLGNEMKKLAMKGPVVVVTTATPKKLLGEAWTTSLKDAGYEHTELLFGGTCTAAEAQRIADHAVTQNAKTLVAFGGGQIIDAVRAAVGLVGDGSVCEFVSCPTVASTDAPCSALCVMYHEDHSFHEYRFMCRHPTLVLVDTTAVAKSPVRMLVGGLGDALATYYEARTVHEAHADNFLGGKQTETAIALSKLCCDILLEDGPAAVESLYCQAVTPALERVVEANTLLSGLGFESGGLCVAHSVHNGLTSQKETATYTHGQKVAFGILTQLILEGRPREELDTVLEFNHKVGLPLVLSGLGVDVSSEKAVCEIAERSLAPGESAHNEPFEVTVDMMVDAIRAADQAGAKFLKEKEVSK
ncbi:Glycerol dehydrogenase [Seminavis robusta]|uniref:Glycerol dehydrogenase n=1 Tax=Seminavis robusta TaxID=568900 RepID=A0A9N8EBJ0_9STRA|nr:Glycerol dehydrogenase [Seminavis robusta]|eukprot:Sro883_g215420.1 Glycerol dehydrogenase (382) ;mRNA; r:698-1843